MNRALAIIAAVLVLVLAVYAGSVTWLLQRERTRATLAAKAGQEAAMASAGAVVQKPATAADVRDAAKPVKAQVDRVVAACPAARTTEVITWRTDPFAMPCAGTGVVPPASPATLLPVAPAAEFQVRGTEARLETADGAVAAVGEVEVWRTRPEPEELLGRRPWHADLTGFLRLSEEKSGPRSGWAAGPAVGWSPAGVMYGGAIEAPSFRAGPVDARGWCAVAAGHGTGTAMVGLLLSW